MRIAFPVRNSLIQVADDRGASRIKPQKTLAMRKDTGQSKVKQQRSSCCSLGHGLSMVIFSQLTRTRHPHIDVEVDEGFLPDCIGKGRGGEL